jgi:hypothetical protein
MKYHKEGVIDGSIQVLCSDSAETRINIKAFFGQPLVFPTWDYAYFKACRLEGSDSLIIPVVNRTQYPITFCIHQKSLDKNPRNSMITSMIEPDKPRIIEQFSVMPILFTYHALDFGPFMQIITLSISNPTRISTNCTLLLQPLKLIGLCIAPGCDHNAKVLELLKKCISMGKAEEEYPTISQRESFFSAIPDPKSVNPREFKLVGKFPLAFPMPGKVKLYNKPRIIL